MGFDDRENALTVGACRQGFSREIRVTVADFSDRPWVYVERWDDGEERPRGSLTLRPNSLRSLIELLSKAEAECARRNGIRPGRAEG